MKNQDGFTIIELMITVSIAAVLLTIGVPAFQGTMSRLNASTIADKLASAVRFARSEAISRNEIISVCASIDGETCNDAAVNWNDGWVVLDSSQQLLRAWSVTTNGVNIQFGDLTGCNNTNPIRTIQNNSLMQFLPDGSASLLPEGGIVADTSMSITSNLAGTQQRLTAISPSGQIQVINGGCDF